MNITSLLITLAGIIFLFALYMMSRIARSKLPKKKEVNIPELKDKNGKPFSSILDDIPARDGSTPTQHNRAATDQKEIEQEFANKESANNKGVAGSHIQATIENESTKQPDDTDETREDKQQTSQHILFISGKEGEQLDGNQIKKALISNGLSLGENDIYHYSIMANSKQISLFRVANGMQPWTLKDDDLNNKKLAGLSVVMITPTKINDVKAMKTFINTTKKLSSSINGIIKNQQQQPLTKEDEQMLINFVIQK